MEEAAARKERLKALKAAQQLVEQGDTAAAAAAAQEAAEPEKPVLKFRNYTVKDEKHIEHEKVVISWVRHSPAAAAAWPQLTHTHFCCCRSRQRSRPSSQQTQR